MTYIHKNFNIDRWRKMAFSEKMGNIGSEVCRAKIWDEKGDIKSRNNALERAIELIGFTIESQMDICRIREITRLREVLYDKLAETKLYNSTLKDLEKYLLDFALVARR